MHWDYVYKLRNVEEINWKGNLCSGHDARTILSITRSCFWLILVCQKLSSATYELNGFQNHSIGSNHVFVTIWWAITRWIKFKPHISRLSQLILWHAMEQAFLVRSDQVWFRSWVRLFFILIYRKPHEIPPAVSHIRIYFECNALSKHISFYFQFIRLVKQWLSVPFMKSLRACCHRHNR